MSCLHSALNQIWTLQLQLCGLGTWTDNQFGSKQFVEMSLVLFVFVVLVRRTSTLGTCSPTNWTYYNDGVNLYMYANTSSKIGWIDATTRCQALHPDATLAIVRNQYVFNRLVTEHNPSWIGLSRNSTTSNFTWIDGVPLAGNASFPRYVKWTTGSTQSNPNCVMVLSIAQDSGYSVQPCSGSGQQQNNQNNVASCEVSGAACCCFSRLIIVFWWCEVHFGLCSGNVFQSNIVRSLPSRKIFK